MAICPKCNDEIDFLRCEVIEVGEHRASASGNGTLEYDWYAGLEFLPQHFRCPVCEVVLFPNAEGVYEFLKGE